MAAANPDAPAPASAAAKESCMFLIGCIRFSKDGGIALEGAELGGRKPRAHEHGREHDQGLENGGHEYTYLLGPVSGKDGSGGDGGGGGRNEGGGGGGGGNEPARDLEGPAAGPTPQHKPFSYKPSPSTSDEEMLDAELDDEAMLKYAGLASDSEGMPYWDSSDPGSDSHDSDSDPDSASAPASDSVSSDDGDEVEEVVVEDVKREEVNTAPAAGTSKLHVKGTKANRQAKTKAEKQKKTAKNEKQKEKKKNEKQKEKKKSKEKNNKKKEKPQEKAGAEPSEQKPPSSKPPAKKRKASEVSEKEDEDHSPGGVKNGGPVDHATVRYTQPAGNEAGGGSGGRGKTKNRQKKAADPAAKAPPKDGSKSRSKPKAEKKAAKAPGKGQAGTAEKPAGLKVEEDG